MKKIIYLIMAASGLLITVSCNKALKNMDDYFPKVNTAAVVVMPDGSVEVTGEIVSEGNASVEYAGFCMDTVPIPEMLTNQVICNITDGKFKTTFTGFNPFKKYYFRTWAANDYGYVLGSVISLDSIKATPVIAPCTPTLNTINIGGGNPNDNLTVAAPVQGVSGWEVIAHGFSSVNTANFVFGSYPSTKIYTTTTSSSPGPDEVYVNFYAGFQSGALSNGSQVYVNQKNASLWEMTICSAPWTYNSSTFYLTTRFMCPH